MEKPAKKISSLGFFTLLLVLFHLSFCHQAICTTVGRDLIQEVAGIERVVTPNGSDGFQGYRSETYRQTGEKVSSIGGNPSSDSRTGPPAFYHQPVICNSIDRYPDCSAGHLISILQKNNCWHRSSGDDPPLHNSDS